MSYTIESRNDVSNEELLSSLDTFLSSSVVSEASAKQNETILTLQKFKDSMSGNLKQENRTEMHTLLSSSSEEEEEESEEEEEESEEEEEESD